MIYRASPDDDDEEEEEEEDAETDLLKTKMSDLVIGPCVRWHGED